MRELDSFLSEALPELDPVMCHEPADYGWRGLTEQGEVLEVKGGNGHAISVPSEIIVARNGRPFGRRVVRNDWTVDIDAYLRHFNRAVSLYKCNCTHDALTEADATLATAPTLRAKFNRSMILLALARWREGLDEYWECEQQAPFMRPQVRKALDCGLVPWRGEDLQGKRLLVMHAHGFGDTIQMLRYLPRLQRMGAELSVAMPLELRPLTMRWLADGECDYFVPILHLLRFLQLTPENVEGSPYITIDNALLEQWRNRVRQRTYARRVGIAWSIGKPSDGDYPREIPLDQLVEALEGDVEIHSVQSQGAEQAGAFGVITHQFNNFADCAALMLQMDEIVSVDTAALHLAGAIGHPNAYGLLSYWHSWRWLAPWYANLRLRSQLSPGDWASALAQLP